VKWIVGLGILVVAYREILDLYRNEDLPWQAPPWKEQRMK